MSPYMLKGVNKSTMLKGDRSIDCAFIETLKWNTRCIFLVLDRVRASKLLEMHVAHFY